MRRGSRFILFTFTLFLLISSSISTDADEDSDDLQELLSIDEQEDQNPDQQQDSARFSEADVLSRAQRIVVELNSDNTRRVIDGNGFVLVLGYAPWCPRSAELMPQFAEAAMKLKEVGSRLLMAKLDADRYPKVASSLEIKGFPTLLLFVNGTSQPYTGGFSALDIVIWVRKKTGRPVIRISTLAQAEEFVKTYHTFVMGLFEKFEGPNYKEFLKAAMTDNEIQFVEVGNSDIAKVLFPDIIVNDLFLGLVKAEPERYTAYEGTIELSKILQFLDYNKFPLVTKLTELNSVRVYSSPIKLQVYIFSKADDFRPLLEPLQDIARKFHQKIMFVNIEITDENLAKPFLTLFGLEEAETTVVAAFDNKDSSKFLLEADPTPNNIDDFISRLVDGTVSPYYKSQQIPDNDNAKGSLFSFRISFASRLHGWKISVGDDSLSLRNGGSLKNASILTIVGKTFDDLVFNSPKTVFLEVYTPWCVSCETTSKQVEKLAKHFKGLASIVFARIDASANEHPKLQLNDFPVLLLYKANDKENPINLPTKSSSKDLAILVNKHLKTKGQVPKDEL